MIAPTGTRAFQKAQELLDFLRPQNPLWGPRPDRWIFRGHSKLTYDLLPTAYRIEPWKPFSGPANDPDDPRGPFELEVLQAQREFHLLQKFLEAADRSGLNVPNAIFLHAMFEKAVGSNFVEFFLDPAVSTFAALAQHHNVPTRLLDWTRVGLNAAYFASSSAARTRHQDGSLCVWALSLAFVEWTREREAYDTLKSAPRVRVVTAPRASNANLHAQSGLFTLWWNTGNIQPLDHLIPQILHALERRPETAWQGDSPVWRLELPWSEAPTLLRLLSDEQVDAARMFPGYDGVVRALKDRNHWDRAY